MGDRFKQDLVIAAPACLGAVLRYARSLSEQTSLSVRVETKVADDVEFSAGDFRTVSLAWDVNLPQTASAGDEEADFDEGLERGDRWLLSAIAHYAATLEALARNPEAARALGTDPRSKAGGGRMKAGSRRPEHNPRQKGEVSDA